MAKLCKHQAAGARSLESKTQGFEALGSCGKGTVSVAEEL